MNRAHVGPLFPEMDASSAVSPTVRADGGALHVAYRLPGCSTCAVVTFTDVASWTYGEPNDEGLREHPLWGHGLTPYNFHEVDAVSAEDALCWVATFHDGTLEVTAGSRPTVVQARCNVSTPSDALNLAFGVGVNRDLDE